MLTNQRFARSTAVFLTLITVAFLLMTFDVRSERGAITGTIRDGAHTLFEPVQAAVNSAIRPIDSAVEALINLAGLRAENDRLRQQLDDANRTLAETEAIRSQNAVLLELAQLELPGDLLEQSIEARVQSGGTSNFDFSLVLSKGSRDGLAEGQPVVNLQGLVGRIDSVTSSSATVKLLTDPDHAVAVQLATTGFVGTASGRGAGDLKFVSSRADGPIAAKEVVVTLAGRYPAGLLVGRIAKNAAPATGAGVQSTIEPAVDFNQLDFVRVILFLPGADQAPAGETPAGGAPAGDTTP